MERRTVGNDETQTGTDRRIAATGTRVMAEVVRGETGHGGDTQ